MTFQYGKGRIFHTPMGHADYSVEGVGSISCLQRGDEWTATGKVTQKFQKIFRQQLNQAQENSINKNFIEYKFYGLSFPVTTFFNHFSASAGHVLAASFPLRNP